MTVEQLISELNKMPKSTEVLIYDAREKEEFPMDKKDLFFDQSIGNLIIG